MPETWEILEKYLDDGKWCACTNQDGLILSALKSEHSNTDSSFHHLITTALYTCPPAAPVANVTQPTPPSAPVPALSVSPPHPVPAAQVTPPVPAPIPSSTSTPPSPIAGAPAYTIHALMKLTLPTLRALAKTSHVRATGNKLELATRIMTLCNPTPSQHQAQDDVFSQAARYTHTSHPSHHQFYRDHFNGVDLHNRFWYQFHFSFRVKHWRTKMLLSVFESAVTNSWVLACEDSQLELAVFRAALFQHLLA
jgi:hypothetical protein